MFVEISKLEQPLHVVHEYKAGILGFKHATARLLDPVHLDTLITRVGINNIFVEGSLKTALTLCCSRCLRDFQRHFEQSFNLFYEAIGSVRRVEEREITYEDMNVAYYDGINLDVDLIVLEQLELSVPMKPICSDSCKGLCEICGADLNIAPCKCSRQEMDQRLVPLLEFKKKMKK